MWCGRAVASLNTPYRPADPTSDIVEKMKAIPTLEYQFYFQEPVSPQPQFLSPTTFWGLKPPTMGYGDPPGTAWCHTIGDLPVTTAGLGSLCQTCPQAELCKTPSPASPRAPAGGGSALGGNWSPQGFGVPEEGRCHPRCFLPPPCRVLQKQSWRRTLAGH